MDPASSIAGLLIWGPWQKAFPHQAMAQCGSSFAACSKERCATAKADFDEARICYEKALASGFESEFEIALLTLLDGDASGAATAMRRLIDAEVWSYRTKRGQAWTHCAIASAQAGDPDSALEALEKLAGEPDLVSTPTLQGLVITARAERELAEGRPATAISLLRAGGQPGTGRAACRDPYPLSLGTNSVSRGQRFACDLGIRRREGRLIYLTKTLRLDATGMGSLPVNALESFVEGSPPDSTSLDPPMEEVASSI